MDDSRHEVLLAARGGIDAPWMLGFLGARLVPAIEQRLPDGYRRSVRLDGRPVVLVVRFVSQRRGSHAIRARTTPPLGAAVVRGLVTRLFDLDADLAEFGERAARDRLLGPLVRRHPAIRMPRYLDGFEGTVRAVLGQQVSLVAARTMTDRFVRRFGAKIDSRGSLFGFPTPEVIARAGRRSVASIGLTGAKATALVSVAEAIVGGRLDWARLEESSPAAAADALTALPGIGPWTAEYVKMRVLGDRDAFPVGDLGLRVALARLARRAPSAADIARRGERWRPWRAYATLHLWNALSDSRQGTDARPARVRRARSADPEAAG